MKKILALIFVLYLFPNNSNAQFDDNQLGAWYMYFFNTTFKESNWGVQGDIQYRNWDIIGDLEQLLLRGGITYKPENSNIKLTLGYGNITTGAFGDPSSTVSESRIYQEALFPSKIGNGIYLNHRLRYEQRWVENQDFRTRYRYNMFVNIPFNKEEHFKEKSTYLALYNELFINGQRDIGNGNRVQVFDRNRIYIGLGYVIKKNLNVQFGWMRQSTNSWDKSQLQFSLHHTI